MIGAGNNAALLQVLGILFVINSVILIIFVLFRQADSGGIGAAFGGGDTGGAFGTKGQGVVDKVIAFMGATFIVLALVYSLIATQAGVTSLKGAEETQAPDGSSEEEDR